MTTRTALKLAAAFGALAIGLAVAPLTPSNAQETPRRPRQEPSDGEAGPQRVRREGQEREGGQRPERGQSVEASMKAMDRALKRVLPQIGDPADRDACLKLLDDAQKGCLNAKSMPAPREALKGATDDAAKAKAGLEYRSEMVKVLAKLIEAEEALLAGKHDRAKAALDDVEKMRERAHKELGIKDDHDH